MKIGIVCSRQEGKSLFLALNSSLPEGCEVVALNYELAAGNEPPHEMMMVPPGAIVSGRDGRSWNNPDPQGIVRFFAENGLDIPVDVEHATQHKAPKGEPAPAMAWGRSLEVKPDGSVWGKFDWNQAGTSMVMNREYRYYSPAYIIDKATMNIVGIKSVGLTNTPNLEVPALNSEHQKEDHMNLAALLAALGLASTATFEDALNSISTMRGDLTVALNAANSPPVDKFVPRGDYDLALNRATTAETELKTLRDGQLETAINHEIDAALAAGKITPGTKDYHIAQCRQEGGLERFKSFVSAAPVIAEVSSLDKKKPVLETAMNAEESAVCEMMGLSTEDYKKHNNLK